MDRWDRIFYVGAEAKSSAVLQGSIVVDGYRKNPEKLDLNGDGVVSYVLLEGESSHQDSLIRTEWSVQTLKDGGVPIEKLTGGIANWERSQASALMEQWLENIPEGCEYDLVIYDKQGNQIGIAKDNGDGSREITLPDWSGSDRYIIRVENRSGEDADTNTEQLYRIRITEKRYQKQMEADGGQEYSSEI